MGWKTLAVRNDGSAYAHPKPLDQARVQLRRAYKSRSRKGKGPAHWRKQVAAVARLHARLRVQGDDGPRRLRGQYPRGNAEHGRAGPQPTPAARIHPPTGVQGRLERRGLPPD